MREGEDALEPMWLKSSGKWVESGWQSLREGGRGGLAVLWTKCSSQCVELLMRAAAERMHVRVTRVAVGAASDLAQISHCADKCKDIDVG